MAKDPFLKRLITSILVSVLNPSKAVSSIANPPNTKGFFNYSAASTANFISKPGVKGLKSLGKALKASAHHNHEKNLNLNQIPLGLNLYQLKCVQV